ncbi:MAG: tetratricopeptide repeat protein, partial [Candidatus Accumulibacter sp.]|nr:tetratricopeptide repeat protein [Accumulibacter sp.]
MKAWFDCGDWAAAEEIARRLVVADGQDEEARHLLAQTVFKQGRTPEAVELMQAVLDIDPTRASYNNDYGVMLASLGRWDEAAAAYGMAVVLDRSDFDARFNLALALLRTGQKERARAELDRVLALRPDLQEALALDGELLIAEGEPAKAVEALKKAIELGQENVYVKLGLALKDMHRDEEALDALQTAERIGDDDALFYLGNFHRDKGDKALAEHFFRRAVIARPGLGSAYNNLGLLLMKERDQTAQAAECFARALACDPRNEWAYVNLGGLDTREGRMESAVFMLERALKLNPRSANAWLNLGYAYTRQSRLDEAEEAFRQALEIQPDFAEAECNLGLVLLLRGRLSEGWARYENRWWTPERAGHRPQSDRPEWAGEALGQRTLLVYREQGFGDNLQFARYLPLLRQRHPEARIRFWCLPPLCRLFTSHAAAWGVELLPSSTDAKSLPPFDAHIALMSLPGRMGTTLENIPAEVPYIAAPPDLAEKWAARLKPLPGRKVGLVWSGNEAYSSQRFRSVSLKQLQPLLGVGGISWVSLQKGDAAGQIAAEGLPGLILDVMDEVGDFADTAAIVANLDLVISVDTAVLHLAGAMGKPVWLLNRFDTDWRWLLEREDSPWYPTMRIFRQA